MSLFSIDHHHPAHVRVSFNAATTIVSVSKKFWPKNCPVNVPTQLCIQPICPSQPNHLRALLCWARCDNSIDDLLVPAQWREQYRHVFLDPNIPLVSIVPTELVLLTEIVAAALSEEAYQFACQHESTLEDWLCDELTVIRHGDIHILPQLSLNGHDPALPPTSFSYRIDMSEPVLQGFARKGTTKFILVQAVVFAPGEAEETERDDEAVEIDEAFLAKSAISSLSILDVSKAAPDSFGTLNSFEEISFCTTPLRRQLDPIGDESTLYVRTTDLSKIGIQNGDWALARPYSASKSRLVRVVANDESVPRTGTTAGSPVLLRNLFPEGSVSQNILYIRSSPFGSRRPPIPLANVLTLARVASPISISQKFQPCVLKSLKVYFESTKRLIRQGDIIAVPIDLGDIVHGQACDDQDPVTRHNSTLSGLPLRSNDIAFFCVTNIEYDVAKQDNAFDIYSGSTIGELGCQIDTALTRIVQSGVEHSWVPNVHAYLQTDRSSPSSLFSALACREFSHLLGADGAYANLLRIISATSPQQAMNYTLNSTVLLKGNRGVGKFTIASWVAQQLGMHLLEASLPFLSFSCVPTVDSHQVNCFDILDENNVKSEGTLRARFEKAKSCTPCILFLRHVDALAQTTQGLQPGKDLPIIKALHECISSAQDGWKFTGYPIVMVGTSSQPNHIPSDILSLFKHEISIEAPGEGERLEMLQCLLIDDVLAQDVSLPTISTQTAGLVASDLVDLVSRARLASVDRVHRVPTRGGDPMHAKQAGIALTADDFKVALRKSRASYSKSIGAPTIPNVTWDDVGGLAHVKSDILDTIQLPLEHPELFSDGLKKRSGILLYGPPGTGKTLLAKAVATSCSLNFFSVKGPELLNMYIGESEANVRRVFQQARDAKPCVIFFDELDSIAPKRGNKGDSGGVMDRIVSQLLAELDGMSSGKGGSDVFVIGATNRPDLLDPALLRPGRFDRMLYLGVSETHEAQRNILEALTRQFRLASDLNLSQVAEQCPFNFTGADFYALCSDAMLNAMSRKAKEVDNRIGDVHSCSSVPNHAAHSMSKAQLNSVSGPHNYPVPLTSQYYLVEMAGKADIEVLVSSEDFDRALENLVPSVSQSEMEHYTRVQQQFSDVAV
ncbi:hypothetical protein H0H93_013975 [Arthromyces matolae]|nr:hypothetical protein H0H93_013975 [Arthromyces matolae]